MGFGYLGVHNGPFGLPEADDFPAVPAHAEIQAAGLGRREFGLELPIVNQVVVDHLIGRDFKMHSFVAIMMISNGLSLRIIFSPTRHFSFNLGGS